MPSLRHRSILDRKSWLRPLWLCLGHKPPPGTVVRARLLTVLDSAVSAQGQKVGAVLDEPLFSAEHKLILPEGTRIDGSVVFVKRAGWFHHTGRLLLNFQS